MRTRTHSLCRAQPAELGISTREAHLTSDGLDILVHVASMISEAVCEAFRVGRNVCCCA